MLVHFEGSHLSVTKLNPVRKKYLDCYHRVLFGENEKYSSKILCNRFSPLM